MLVLTRKIGEQIVIETGIHLTVVAVEGQRVRLGIDAPDSVAILRSELVDDRPFSLRCEGRRLGRSKRPRARLLR